ncbi:MAG TPA: hypothetical protein PKC45_14765 [Gemmatales bacterium]|nr:hypothetical protein [Gemmatales bacterium]
MSTTADIDQLSTGARCFRLRRYYLVVGVVCTVFFAVMGIASTVAALWNIDGSFARPKLAALIFGIFWSGFTLLAVWVIVAYFRERLYFGKAGVVQHGIFRSRTLLIEEVQQIRWRTWPVGGSVVIRTHSEKATIHLDNFTKDEREELIRFLRESFAVEIQENWSRFQDLLGRSSRQEKRVSRSGIITIAALLMSFAGVFVYCWFAGLGVQNLVIGVVNAVAAIWYLARLRLIKDGKLLEDSESAR